MNANEFKGILLKKIKKDGLFHGTMKHFTPCAWKFGGIACAGPVSKFYIDTIVDNIYSSIFAICKKNVAIYNVTASVNSSNGYTIRFMYKKESLE